VWGFHELDGLWGFLELLVGRGWLGTKLPVLPRPWGPLASWGERGSSCEAALGSVVCTRVHVCAGNCGSFWWLTGRRHIRGIPWHRYLGGRKQIACRSRAKPAGAGTAGSCRHHASAVPVCRRHTPARGRQGSKSARGGERVLANQRLAARRA
jgi:hypothetical protein